MNSYKKDNVLRLIHLNFLFLMELIIERISSHSSQNVCLLQTILLVKSFTIDLVEKIKIRYHKA